MRSKNHCLICRRLWCDLNKNAFAIGIIRMHWSRLRKLFPFLFRISLSLCFSANSIFIDFDLKYKYCLCKMEQLMEIYHSFLYAYNWSFLHLRIWDTTFFLFVFFLSFISIECSIFSLYSQQLYTFIRVAQSTLFVFICKQ